ncbi:glycosyl hydrolase family 2 [Spirosoma oryzae]|uniref:Glycosyl hydrolase family 2 n=1 Tax=Spirosoma oryzae TaxID=1469603 RepID=A0A2T0SLY1_9BACT|nr:glycoside hydrolase family 2 TIM barrel-domain containing protein [Spirosoma oryzae]PRY34405.1 glycosyl hydrolase family 2 [Spirosoma oryzae]
MRIPLLSLLLTLSVLTANAQRWTAQQANTWYKTQPFLVGANFIPSTAINQLEMWQADTFDPATIDKELGYAEGIGMNVMRVFLHNLVWEQDAEGFKKRIDQFLQIADKHHIKIMFVLFDSCWNDDPQLGKQPAPVTGKHNSGWVRAPGTKRLFDSRTWAGLEQYTKGVLTAFANDKRVLVWDLFNEPTNSGYNDAVMPLLTKTFAWAQAVRPSQPITAGWWNDHELSNDLMFAQSDIITFHNYNEAPKLEAQIIDLQKRFGRPLICTEYMARTRNSTFQSSLPIFKKYKVGAINWGLVKGKTNTIYAWNAPMPDGKEPPIWFHDIFRPDGSVFDPAETALIKQLAK